MTKSIVTILALYSLSIHATSYRTDRGLEIEISKCIKDQECRHQIMQESPVKIAKILNNSPNTSETKSILNTYIESEDFDKFDSLYRLRMVKDPDLVQRKDGKKLEARLRSIARNYKFNYATDYIRNNNDQFKSNPYINGQIMTLIKDEIKNSPEFSEEKQSKLMALHKDGLINLSQITSEVSAELTTKPDECFDCSVQTATTSEYMSITSLEKVAEQMIQITSTWSTECDLKAENVKNDVFFHNKSRRAKRNLERHSNTTYINQETFENGCTKKIEAKAYRK